MSSQIEKWKEREEKRKKLAEERQKHREEQIKKSQVQAQEQEEPKAQEQEEKRKHRKPKQAQTEKTNPEIKQTDQEQPKPKKTEEHKQTKAKKQEKPKNRRQKPKPKKTEDKNNNLEGVRKMAETNWNEELKNDETYKQAEKLGIDMSSFTADSEDAKKAQLEEIKKKIKEMEANGNQTPPNDGKKNDDTQRGTLEVNGEDKDTPTPENEDWIKQKRDFYEKFAHDQDLVMKNDPAKDTEEKSFTFSLEKNGKSLGEMKYTNPTSVQISKDSEIQMYQGLVKDALDNDLAISFGKSLDEKQQAMLLAAVLMSDKKTYANGDGIELKNPPQIDLNAEYFKTLPQDVQTVLKDHVEKQAQQDVLNKEAEEKARKEAEEKAQQEEAKARQEALQKKLQSMRAKVEQRAQALGKETKELTGTEYREAYREALHEGLTDEQKQARQEKLNDREKILAARLGLIPEHTTKDKDGKPVTITKDQKTADLIQKTNPERFKELQNKYSGRN